MQTSAGPEEMLTALSKVLLWCFVVGTLLLLFWFGWIMAAGDLAYRLHARMFGLSRHEFDMLNYYGLTCVKVCLVLFFLIPWLGTRFVLKGARSHGTD